MCSCLRRAGALLGRPESVFSTPFPLAVKDAERATRYFAIAAVLVADDVVFFKSQSLHCCSRISV